MNIDQNTIQLIVSEVLKNINNKNITENYSVNNSKPQAAAPYKF